MESFEELQTTFTPMIHHIMRKLSIYKNRDEFFQVGLIALWQAHQRFNPAKGSFSAFAYAYIRGSLMQELTKATKDTEHYFYATDEVFEPFEATNTPPLYEEDTILALCQNHKLTENQTKWVLYYSHHGLKNKEIAAIENVSASTVKGWRVGALEKLRKDPLLCLSELTD